MKKSIGHIINSIVFLIIVFGFALLCIFMKDNEFSLSERRYLTDFPEITNETVANGQAMKDFSVYMADQFPFRDEFRTIKAHLLYSLYGEKDNNGIFVVDGSVSKLDYKLNEKSVKNFVEKIERVENMYLGDTNKVYFVHIPDKNYYIAGQGGYPSYDYDRMNAMLSDGLSDTMEIIDIFSCLDKDDYYNTDSHWKSENLSDVVAALADEMDIGDRINTDKEIGTLNDPFYGVYKGQSALNLPAETIRYPLDDAIKNAKVTDLDRNKVGGMYWSKDDGNEQYDRDRYTYYLNGSSSLLTIENPLAEADTELIIFRDSFGSALAPWLTEAYSKITVVDIRYLQPEILKMFVNFENADVLFMYSSGVINNSDTIK